MGIGDFAVEAKDFASGHEDQVRGGIGQAADKPTRRPRAGTQVRSIKGLRRPGNMSTGSTERNRPEPSRSRGEARIPGSISPSAHGNGSLS
jgi:hypothetical protein